MSVKTPQRLFMGSLVIFFLTLGVYFTQVRSFSNPKSPAAASERNDIPQKTKTVNAAVQPIPTPQPVSRILPIEQSKVNKDAVMAFVFFNSKQDFENAQLKQRGLLLNTFQPYLHNDEDAQGENLSIFLFDESGNVVQKSSIQLPQIEDE